MTIAPSQVATAAGPGDAVLFRRVGLRLVPLLCLCYVMAYLDRINIGFAKLQMSADLGLSESAYGLGAGMFFVGYILLEVPSNVILQRVGARVWVARIMISWGLISALFAFVTTQTQFFVLRLVLGAAEAGFLPGVLFYLSEWLPARFRARVMAMFLMGLPAASAFGGPLSGWLLVACDNALGWAGLAGDGCL